MEKKTLAVTSEPLDATVPRALDTSTVEEYPHASLVQWMAGSIQEAMKFTITPCMTTASSVKFGAKLKLAHRYNARERAGNHVTLNAPLVLQRLAAAVGHGA